jgi:hypothetical protein
MIKNDLKIGIDNRPHPLMNVFRVLEFASGFFHIRIKNKLPGTITFYG